MAATRCALVAFALMIGNEAAVLGTASSESGSTTQAESSVDEASARVADSGGNAKSLRLMRRHATQAESRKSVDTASAQVANSDHDGKAKKSLMRRVKKVRHAPQVDHKWREQLGETEKLLMRKESTANLLRKKGKEAEEEDYTWTQQGTDLVAQQFPNKLAALGYPKEGDAITQNQLDIIEEGGKSQEEAISEEAVMNAVPVEG